MKDPCTHRYLDPATDSLLPRPPVPRRALFLDRDGVINIDRGYVHSPEQTAWIPGIFALCREALAAGYLPIVVTNQAGIARGLYSEAQFHDYTAWVHRKFSEQGAPLLATYYCPHHPIEGIGIYLRECGCRKPRSGMFMSAAADFGIELVESLMIGNKASDMHAGITAGLGTCLLLGDHSELLRSPAGVHRLGSLQEATFQKPCSDKE